MKGAAVSKVSSKKREKHVKNHIETLMKGRPIRFRVIAFAQRIAAKKIQRAFRRHRAERAERERRIFEAKLREFSRRVATQRIQRRWRDVLAYRAYMREYLAHVARHERRVVFVQQKFRQRAHRPRKLNVRRFKEVLLASIRGWQARRRFLLLKSDPEC